MSSLVRTSSTRDALITATLARGSEPGFPALLAAYLGPVPESELPTIDATALAATVAAHLELGACRRVGQHLVRVLPPGVGSHTGSIVALLVTEDRPFLVDTISMELTRQEWTLRRLYHPQLRVRRDVSGRVLDLTAGADGTAESWIAVEIYPPLGQAAETLTEPLLAGLNQALQDTTVAVDDWRAMLAKAEDAIEELESEHPHTPAVADAVDLLNWLVEDHFVFLGYADYTLRDGRLEPVAGSGLGILRGVTESDPVTVPAAGERDPLVLVRNPRRSPVHRPVYLEHLAVRRYAPGGDLVREHRFLGLLATNAYTESVANIPVLAAKGNRLLDRSGFEPHSYGWNAIRQVIAGYPRDELFEASVDELAPIVAEVAALRERRQTRVFLRRARYGSFATALVYLPRDRYNTATRLRIQQVLLSELGGVEVEFTTLVSESVLTRLFFVVRLGPDAPSAPDIARIVAGVSAATRSWEDDFVALVDALPSEQRGVEFSEAYTADYPPDVAVADLAMANLLAGHDDLRLSLTEPLDDTDPSDLRLKIISHQTMSLTQLMPHLSVLGAEVIDERPYSWDLRGTRVMVYDFGLKLPAGADDPDSWDADGRQRFMDVVTASWTLRCEADNLNRLVVSAGLDWRQVSWLRGISRYLLQAGVPFSQTYIATAMNANPTLAAGLVAAYEIKFAPERFADDQERAAALAQQYRWLREQLDAVVSLDHDRILRAFLAVIEASVRTNAFAEPETWALKLLPTELSLLPEPRPEFEVFTYSPRVHGVHLRFGRVARGGLRWSDRPEDFRTEVLGLVKAQVVKNTVIVPVGAKGGFVPQRLPGAGDREAWLAEGRACYRLFVDALLSVTDNIVDSQVVPADRVVRYDGDDPYLVVAADKGTATFSDLANEVSTARGFWLGDAFASGGSTGYDHKAMGITALGAWESVKRHFTELGLDPAVDEFTCVGIGDMAGDVFGNGMLASDRIRLVAAFNHQHIFLDPDPDPMTAFAERRRLFGLPGSGWADYDPSRISAGGGVYRRDAKSVPLTAGVRRALGLEDVTALTPAELISAILTAPVDLLFNGGVGTFVKATQESSAQVGDKANDPIRVNGGQLRARCVAEGGNLGFTQLGRVEYARSGGRINTDFIDNSAGVDTSDHEVNIKILLAPEVAAGRLSLTRRTELLASMTDEVAGLVLAHNFDQNLALANSMHRRLELAGQHEAWMRTLETAGFLDRQLEFLPSSDELTARIAAGDGLTRPELAVLLSYTKIALSRWVLDSDLPDDPYLADRLVQYFPQPLRERYAAAMPRHRLAREIITTVAVNRFVNSQGITAYHRLSTETGAGVADIVRAQLASRAIFAVGLEEVRLRRRSDLAAAVTTDLRVTLRRMVERATRWLLHHQRGPLEVATTVAEYGPDVAELRPRLLDLLTGEQADAAVSAVARWTSAGVPRDVAATMATAAQAHTLLSVVQVAHRLDADPLRVARVHHRLAHELALDLLVSRVDVLPRQVRWDAMARAALRDELLAAHAELTAAALAGSDPAASPEQVVADWLLTDPRTAARVETIRQLADGTPDVARMNVGLSQVRAMLPG